MVMGNPDMTGLGRRIQGIYTTGGAAAAAGEGACPNPKPKINPMQNGVLEGWNKWDAWELIEMMMMMPEGMMMRCVWKYTHVEEAPTQQPQSIHSLIETEHEKKKPLPTMKREQALYAKRKGKTKKRG